jgi:hypothetical protein
MVTLSSSTALQCDTRTASTGHKPRPPSENVSLRIVFRITYRFEPQRHRGDSECFLCVSEPLWLEVVLADVRKLFRTHSSVGVEELAGLDSTRHIELRKSIGRHEVCDRC